MPVARRHPLLDFDDTATEGDHPCRRAPPGDPSHLGRLSSGDGPAPIRRGRPDCRQCGLLVDYSLKIGAGGRSC